MTKVTEFFYGKEMHTKISGPEDNYYENIWEWPSEQEEQSIKDDVIYTVSFELSEWDTTGSLMGDSVGKRQKVIAFEETPKEVTDIMNEIKRHYANIDLLSQGLNVYKLAFSKKKNTEI